MHLGQKLQAALMEHVIAGYVGWPIIVYTSCTQLVSKKWLVIFGKFLFSSLEIFLYQLLDQVLTRLKTITLNKDASLFPWPTIEHTSKRHDSTMSLWLSTIPKPPSWDNCWHTLANNLPFGNCPIGNRIYDFGCEIS